MLSITNLTSYTPPIPLAPNPPDFSFCHPAYGTHLRRQDGLYAGGILPQGALPVDYIYTDDDEGGQVQLNELPYNVEYGGIVISVEIAGPVDIDTISIVPNRIRGMAGHIANTCVGQRGMGGFITHKIQGLVDFVTDPMTNLDDPEYPDSSAFITLTMSSPPGALSFPGDYDPVMARFLSQVENNALSRMADHGMQAEILNRMIRYGVQETRMSRLGSVSWWGASIANGNIGSHPGTIQRANGTTASSTTTARRRRRRSKVLF
ncbi:hypothetical protein ACLMJK_006392 [Lecanora helva]